MQENNKTFWFLNVNESEFHSACCWFFPGIFSISSLQTLHLSCLKVAWILLTWVPFVYKFVLLSCQLKDRFYSSADPKTTAWQLLDGERCKYKCLLELCIYSDGHPKLTALFTKQLLDLERCKNKLLLEICFYSDTGPKLLLDQERLIFWSKFASNRTILDETGQAGSRGVENTWIIEMYFIWRKELKHEFPF